MKKLSKILICVTAALLIAAALIVCIVFVTRKDKPVQIAFYNLTPAQEQTVTEHILSSPSLVKKSRISFVHLDSDRPLEQELPSSATMLVTLMGQSAQDAYDSAAEKSSSLGFDFSMLKDSTISLKNMTPRGKNNKISQLPILLDNNEILLDIKLLDATKTTRMQTWTDVETFAAASKEKIKFPMVFAGSDSSVTLGILGAMTESFSGADQYRTAAEKILAFYKENPDAQNIQVYDLIKSLSEDPASPLYAATYTLQNLIKKQLLHPECFHMTHNDVKAFMDNKMAAVVFTSLTEHRNVNHETIERYKAIPRVLENGGDHAGFYPSNRKTNMRSLNTPVICAVPLKSNRSMVKVAAFLLAPSSQDSLCLKTGLAPVLAQSHVPDIQSDDVRFWAAATEAPLQPLDTAAFTNPANREQFVREYAGYVTSLANQR